jgi:uncharacterized protein YjbI with pentapeptide repeats
VRQIHFEVHFKVYFGFLQILYVKDERNYIHCSLVAVDFMSTNLTAVLFSNCDLYRSEFEKAIADKADFRTSYNYSIDPTKTKLKKSSIFN